MNKQQVIDRLMEDYVQKDGGIYENGLDGLSWNATDLAMDAIRGILNHASAKELKSILSAYDKTETQNINGAWRRGPKKY